MTNLLKETIEDIEASGHTPGEVAFIGSSDAKYRLTWDEFEKLADVEYHSGYGAAEVATDLVVRFSDGRSMWRHEYDGAERWEWDAHATVDYSRPGLPVVQLVVPGGLWPNMHDINDPKEREDIAVSKW